MFIVYDGRKQKPVRKDRNTTAGLQYYLENTKEQTDNSYICSILYIGSVGTGNRE